MNPELSVLIVNYNTWRDCVAAVQSLRQNAPLRSDGSRLPYEVIVVDNKSPQRDPSDIAALQHALAEVAADQGDATAGRLILHDENGGYSKGVNLCFQKSRGRWILVSNPDLLFSRGCIDALLRHLEQNPRTGCALPKGYWDVEHQGHLPPNTLPTLLDLVVQMLAEFCRPLRRWYGRRLLRHWLQIWETTQPLSLRMMSGCLFLMARDYFESIGLLDERFPLYYEDSDLSVRIQRSGRELVQVPDARLVHFVNRSGQTDLETMWSRHDVSKDLYFRKWYGRLGGAVHGFVHRFLRSSRGRRWTKEPPDTPWVDLGSSAAPPLLRFPHCERFLVLVALDCRFHLSGGCYGRGDHWTPGPALFANFGPTTYWCRVHDVSSGQPRHVGTWRYDCRKQVETPPPAASAVPAEAVRT